MDTLSSPVTPMSVPGAADVWEYCEIRGAKHWVGLGKRKFEAVSTGPKGSRVIAKTWAFGGDFEAGSRNRINITRLVNKLTAEGWEPQPQGSAWYAHRFRRRVSK